MVFYGTAVIAAIAIFAIGSEWLSQGSAPMALPTVIRMSTAPINAPIEVVDGDTVRSDGKAYRLVGFNTPESGFGARCERERNLAAQATRRLRQLIASGGAQLQRVNCAKALLCIPHGKNWHGPGLCHWTLAA
jgi:endonuclease YncB( thermonuclease family)